jgi:hypothetical protein
MSLRIAKLASGRVLLLGLVGTFGWCAGAQAAEPVVGAGGFPLLSLKEIVVEASKVPETPADAELNKQVESLRGLVFDDWDVRTAIRLSRRIAGVKRVINQLEIGAQP